MAENSLLHIALHILEEDVEHFYKKILNCETERSFTLQNQDTNSIFGIGKEVTVQLVLCGGIYLELFIDDKIESHNFGHVCFQSTEAEKIFKMAKENGFKTFVRKKNSSETYFISDSNNNLFEVKSSVNRVFEK